MERKRKGTAVSMPVGLMWGGGVSLAVTLIGSGVLAKLLDAEIIQWETAGYMIIGMLMLAAFLGSCTAWKKIKRRKLQAALTAGGVYWLLLIGITALFFGQQYEAVGVTAAVIFAGSACAAMLGIRPERGGKSRKYRSRHC